MTVRCYPCTLGNHSGTNGTPGCTGGSCRCPCRILDEFHSLMEDLDVAAAEIDDDEHAPHVLVVVDGHGASLGPTAKGPYFGILAAMTAAVAWHAELNHGVDVDAVDPADVFVVVPVRLYPAARTTEGTQK